MGTSNIYNGPGGKNKLLPDWLNNENLTPEQQDNIANEWKTAKTVFTRALNNHKKNDYSFINHYIKAYNGSKGFVKSSVGFKKSFNYLFSFINDVGKFGQAEAIKKLGDEFIGKTLQEIFIIFSNSYFPSGNDKEESATRDAMTKTFEMIYMELQLHPNLDVLNDNILNIILRNFISEYVLSRILSDIGRSYEFSKIDKSEIQEFETNIKKYIRACVDSQINNINFIQIKKDDINIDEILESCIKKLGGE